MFSSHNMINHKDLCILKFEKMVEKLYKNNGITSVEADKTYKRNLLLEEELFMLY